MSTQVCLPARTNHGAALLDDLEAQLQCQLTGRIHGLRLLDRDGGLVLQGRVHTYYAKQLAQQVVMNATDRPIAANEIEVF